MYDLILTSGYEPLPKDYGVVLPIGAIYNKLKDRAKIGTVVPFKE